MRVSEIGMWMGLHRLKRSKYYSTDLAKGEGFKKINKQKKKKKNTLKKKKRLCKQSFSTSSPISLLGMCITSRLDNEMLLLLLAST